MAGIIYKFHQTVSTTVYANVDVPACFYDHTALFGGSLRHGALATPAPQVAHFQQTLNKVNTYNRNDPLSHWVSSCLCPQWNIIKD